MSLSLVTAPVSYPVTLVEALNHLRISHGLENDHVSNLIGAAVSALDGNDGTLGRALMGQTWDLKLDAFPRGVIDVPLPPLQSVEFIKYMDVDGNEQTLGGANYQVATGDCSPLSRILPIFGEVWPVTRPQMDAVTVRFICGYNTTIPVPPAIHAALLLMIGHLYERREDTIVGATIGKIQAGAESLLAPFRVRTQF